MSSIQSLGISGIRGYTPQNYQRIQFMKPLTLIWGKNGSGKTTIIECLKYITTGALPPNSDKGKSFVMDTKVAGKPQVIGDIRMIFKTGNRAILAKRRIMLSAKGNTNKFESIQQVLKTKGQNGQDLTINHQCAQIQKQVPQFLGISKPILQNIVFCHQDQSLWPFGDSVLLKNIFDQLFQTKKVTKQMQRIWELHKDQQSQLKQMKVRLEYLKQAHKRQLDERSKIFQELQQINLRAKQMQQTKHKIWKMKDQLKDNSQKVKQRQKIIFQKGRLQSSISNLELKIKGWKQSFLRIQKQFEDKMKGKNNNSAMQEDSYAFNASRSHNMSFLQSKPLSASSQVQKVKFLPIQSTQTAREQLQYKRQFYKQLVAKYSSTKQQYQTLKSFKQTSKREQQIKSEQERIKALMPELKFSREIKTEEEFLKFMKQRLVQMEQKNQGKQLNKRKLDKMQIPELMGNGGFDQKQVDDLKKQSKQLQSHIQLASIQILKVYKAQYKPIPQTNLINPSNMQHGQSLQAQLQSTLAIISSKQSQLKHYQQLSESNQYMDKETLQKQIHHYRIAGVQLQQEMLHFCQQKKKCYFCSRKMTDKQIQAATQKVEIVKNKAEQRLRELQNRKNQTQAVVDPSIMIKKLKDEIKKLMEKYNMLKIQVGKYQQLKKNQSQIMHNNILSKQLNKCNLSIQILSKLGHIAQNDNRPDSYYEKVSVQQLKQMCSSYLVRLTRYKSVKEQTKKFEQNQQRNEIIRKSRQQVIKKMKQLKQIIVRAQQQTKNYDFLKNSYNKLQSLIKMQTKSKSRKGGVQSTINNQGNSSQNNSYSSVQQAQHSLKELYVQILQQKVYIQKLQISIGNYNDSILLSQQRQRYQQINNELLILTRQLKTSQQLLNNYNHTYHQYDKQSQRIKHKLQIITQSLNQPMDSTYLITLNKSRHLQASINHLELSYHLLQQSVSQYHSQKMEEINRYIYQVWRQIYHGDDIEYIQIQAMVDGGSKKKKKNYQYRILMKKSTKNFKSQQLVDMKGRCSTGQKVLASIVIRLALAQVFCSSTRILALDEPTTNLDKQHIQNLAQALLRLIQLSGGKNLQLIIISHDIQFIKLLQQYADSYYEVKRDANRFSTIQKRMIRDIYSSK